MAKRMGTSRSQFDTSIKAAWAVGRGFGVIA